MKKIIYILLLTITLTSCVKDKLYEQQQIVDSTKITLKVNWSNIITDKPQELTIKVGEQMRLIAERPSTDTFLVKPDTYNVFAYNIATGCNIEDNIIHINTNNNGNIIPNAGLFYSAYKKIIAKKDELTDIEIAPMRQMYDLLVMLNMGSDTTEYTLIGEITNVAGSFDMTTEQSFDAKTLEFNFTQNDSVWAVTKVLGVIGSKQIFKLTLDNEYRGKVSKTMELDSLFFTNFTGNKSKSIILKINAADLR